MPIYEQPTRVLMHDFAKAEIQPDEIFHKQKAVDWFAERYPRINPNTVKMHVDGMSVNSRRRLHHPTIRPGAGFDLFYKVGKGAFRLWNPGVDPAPLYLADTQSEFVEASRAEERDEEEDDTSGLGSEFGAEADLQRYLVKNLSALEPELRLYNDDGLEGVEFPVGGRRIDILGVGADGALVVVELKVSRGYDKVVGQILRYIAWIKHNLAEGRPVRGIIVARNIGEDLRLAASEVPGIRLVEYEISFALKQVWLQASP